MNKKEIVNELNSALKMLSTIAVSHEAVDMMAAGKSKIRNAIAELEKSDKPNEGGKK